MARGIVRRVGLDLDDAPADTVPQERPAEQSPRDLVDVSREQLLQASSAVGEELRVLRPRACAAAAPASRTDSAPISSRIVSCVREATIAAAIPSTQTSVRRPFPRSSPTIGSSA